MTGSLGTVVLKIVFLNQVGQPLIVVGQTFFLTYTAEDLAVFVPGGILDLDLVTDAPQESLVHQVARGQVC